MEKKVDGETHTNETLIAFSIIVSNEYRGTVVNWNDSITCPSWVHGFKTRIDSSPVARMDYPSTW